MWSHYHFIPFFQFHPAGDAPAVPGFAMVSELVVVHIYTGRCIGREDFLLEPCVQRGRGAGVFVVRVFIVRKLSTVLNAYEIMLVPPVKLQLMLGRNNIVRGAYDLCKVLYQRRIVMNAVKWSNFSQSIACLSEYAI